MKWKSTKPPQIGDWHKEVIKWSKAEGMEIKREEQKGLRKRISLEWNIMVEQFIAATLPNA